MLLLQYTVSVGNSLGSVARVAEMCLFLALQTVFAHFNVKPLRPQADSTNSF